MLLVTSMHSEQAKCVDTTVINASSTKIQRYVDVVAERIKKGLNRRDVLDSERVPDDGITARFNRRKIHVVLIFCPTPPPATGPVG